MRLPRFHVYQAADGWRWQLKAANGRVLCTGEAHTSQRDAWRAVATVQAAAVKAVS